MIVMCVVFSLDCVNEVEMAFDVECSSVCASSRCGSVPMALV